MLLARLVETSTALAATASRTAKIALVADALREAGDGEAALVAAYLSKVLPQRRLGLGWRGLSALRVPAAEPSLTLAEVDAAFERIARASGPGSTAARSSRNSSPALAQYSPSWALCP